MPGEENSSNPTDLTPFLLNGETYTCPGCGTQLFKPHPQAVGVYQCPNCNTNVQGDPT